MELGFFINGNWERGSADRRLRVINPATGAEVGSVANAGPADVAAAVSAAAAAFPGWASQPPKERQRLLRAAAVAVRQHQEELAPLLTREQGKPLPDARKEIDAAVDTLEYYADEAVRISGEIAPISGSARSLVIRQPVGVVAAIAPWNYPVSLIAWKLAPALAAGCTVVVKPSPYTPLAALRFTAICAGVGFPPGAINALATDDLEAARALVRHPDIAAVAFTGSTRTGQAIMADAALAGVRRVNLELGGHSPLVVFADADLDRAVADGVKRSFRNAGQICNAVNRIYVEESVAAAYVERFVAATEKLRQGDGLADPTVDLGPMTTPDGPGHIRAQVADAVARGARVACGERPGAPPDAAGDRFVRPTVLVDVSPEMRVMHEESFGPLVAIDTFRTVAEAVAKANSTSFGLVAYVYTGSLRTAMLVSEQIAAGSVAVNSVSPDSLQAPYTGWKSSGIGVELSRYGLEPYLHFKHIRLELS